MAKDLDLVERGGSGTLELSVAEYETLVGLKIVNVRRGSSGKYSIEPRKHVGSIRFGDVQLNVRPKITEINRLLFFIGYCDNPAIWRDEFVRLDKADGLFPAVAESFIRLTSRAIEQGLLQGYTAKSGRLAVMRGKLQFREQMTRSFGLPLPISVEYDDFTDDIVENRVILLATLRLLGLQEINAENRQRLSRIRALLDDITLPHKWEGTPKWTANRLNARYHDALKISKVILDNSSFDQETGTLAVSGFMFDMEVIYENFVTGSIAMALKQFGGTPKTQGELDLVKNSKLKIKPDLVWYDKENRAVAVIDAKYKSDQPRQDLYQMLAYCLVLNLNEGHLVYAKGSETKRTYKIHNCGITIYCHSLDLGLTPAEILDNIDNLAGMIMSRST